MAKLTPRILLQRLLGLGGCSEGCRLRLVSSSLAVVVVFGSVARRAERRDRLLPRLLSRRSNDIGSGSSSSSLTSSHSRRFCTWAKERLGD